MVVIIGDIPSTSTVVLELSWLARVSLEGSMLKSLLQTTYFVSEVSRTRGQVL